MQQQQPKQVRLFLKQEQLEALKRSSHLEGCLNQRVSDVISKFIAEESSNNAERNTVSQ